MSLPDFSTTFFQLFNIRKDVKFESCQSISKMLEIVGQCQKSGPYNVEYVVVESGRHLNKDPST